jgi:hypothetical protein
MAAFYHSRKTWVNTIYARAAAAADPDHCLESYHYMNPRTIETLRNEKKTIFLDSGAFSMFTQGVQVDLKAYGEFIKAHTDIVHVSSNLDVIGAGHELESYNRQKELEAMGVPNIYPVHHVRDEDWWLERYLDEGYDYIFLGGMVPETTAYLRQWLDHVWHNYLTTPDGRPKIKVHGFGLTTNELIFRYPWYSVDSTSWVTVAQFGSILMDFPQPDGSVRDYKVDFSTKSERRRDINSWHFDTLTKPEQFKILERLEQLEAVRIKKPELENELGQITGYPQGYTQRCMAESYGWRDHFNIHYYNRAQERRVGLFLREQESLFG